MLSSNLSNCRTCSAKRRLNYDEDTNVKHEAEEETGEEDQVQEPARKKQSKGKKEILTVVLPAMKKPRGRPPKRQQQTTNAEESSLTKRPKGRKKKQDEGQFTASADEIRDKKIRDFTQWYSESDNLDYEEVMSRAQGIDGATMLKILGIKKRTQRRQE